MGQPAKLQVSVSDPKTSQPVTDVVLKVTVRLISLTYFTGIVVIGFLLGLWLRHRQTPRTGLTWKRSVS